MHDDLSDERLMLAYRDGDAAAFEALYGRYRTRLYRHLAHQCSDARLAEELYQDIWLKVVNARADYEPLAKFSTWLYRIAHHRLLDHYRQRSRDVAELFDASTDPDDLREALGETKDLDTVWAKITIDDDNRAIIPATAVQWQGDAQVTVWPVDQATGELIAPVAGLGS